LPDAKVFFAEGGPAGTRQSMPQQASWKCMQLHAVVSVHQRPLVLILPHPAIS